MQPKSFGLVLLIGIPSQTGTEPTPVCTSDEVVEEITSVGISGGKEIINNLHLVGRY